MSNFLTPEFNNESAIAPWNTSLEATPGIIPKLDPNRTLTGGVGQEVNIPTLTPNTYDNIILPDAVPTLMAKALTTDSNTSLQDSSVDLLTGQAMSEVYEDLSKFAAEPDFVTEMNVAFGENWDAAGGKALAEGWFNRDFSAIPPVKVVSSAEIGGANGAFAAATDTIYLSKEFLAQNGANPAAVADVLLEEIGHSVDARLNVTDSPGDEGAIFAAVVQGKELSQGELQALKSEDDRATVTIDGKIIEIEEQQLSGGSQGTILGVQAGSSILLGGELTRNDSNNPTRYGTFADDYRFDTLSPGQQFQLDLKSDDFDSYLQLVDERTGQVIGDDDAGGNRNSRLSFTVQPNSNYIVRATSYYPGDTGSYTISSAKLSNPIPDPDGTPDKAKPLVLQGKSLSNGKNGGIVETENIGRNYDYGKDSADYYKFSLNETRRINIALDNLTADADIALFRGDNTFIAESRRSFTSLDAISRELQPGTYYVKVVPYQAEQTDYKLRITELTGNIQVKITDFVTERGIITRREEDKNYTNGVNLYRFDQNGRKDDLAIEPGKDTIVVIHGWKDSTDTDDDGNPSPIKSLGEAAAKKYPNYQVLALDWRFPAISSTDRKNIGDGLVPFRAAQSITPVAKWAVNALINLGINPDKLSIFGHSLGSYVGTEIGRLFNEDNNGNNEKLGQIKNFVALDPANPIDAYDIDGNTPGIQNVKKEWDFAKRSIALVGKEGALTIGGQAGSNEGAARAQDSLVVDLTDAIFNPLKPTEYSGSYHIAPVRIFQKALEKNYLKLEQNLALPNDLRPNSYDDNANVAQLRNGRNEGRIVAQSDGTIIQSLEYVNRTGGFNDLKDDGRAWTS
ncbi:pre-peptidase C-terminal domain-containing protein [Microcoleus sp. A006_D1]|uniref:pre-peptidase C-terminal domain-containing protein n=1 Tax=Microcoleus sp. A006_D1 TaxID=3055267 RepID=UPI002FD08E1F